jgi:hypothetical protein
MSRLRIVCKAPPATEPSPGLPRLNLVPTYEDMAFTLVDDAGVEHAITNVSAVCFECKQGEMATATLDFFDVELETDLDAGDVNLELAELGPEATR